MNLRQALAGATGVAFMIACSGSHKIGDGNQSTEGSGGESAGGQSNQGGDPSAGGDPGSFGGQGGDPSVGGDPGSYAAAPSYAGGSYGGLVGAGGVSYGGASYGGDPGAGGVAYGGATGAGGSVGFGGCSGMGGGLDGAGGQSVAMPLDQGAYHPSTPGIDVGGAPNADVTGSWVGYVENFAFPSGSDAVSMTISQGAQTGLEGHVVVGQGSGALPDLLALILAGNGGMYDALTTPVEGFSYTVMNGHVIGSRLQFDIAPSEAWAPVCNAQTPFPGSRSCASTMFGPPDSSGKCLTTIDCQDYLIDCGALYACTSACRCDDAHCFFDTSANLVHFDVAYRQPYLDGSVAGLTSNSVSNIHFSPQ